MTRRQRTALGAVALALALPGAWLDPPTFFAAWLAAWWLGLGIVFGALANRWVHALTGGQWGVALEPVTRAARATPAVAAAAARAAAVRRRRALSVGGEPCRRLARGDGPAGVQARLAEPGLRRRPRRRLRARLVAAGTAGRERRRERRRARRPRRRVAC